MSLLDLLRNEGLTYCQLGAAWALTSAAPNAAAGAMKRVLGAIVIELYIVTKECELLDEFR